MALAPTQDVCYRARRRSRLIPEHPDLLTGLGCHFIIVERASEAP